MADRSAHHAFASFEGKVLAAGLIALGVICADKVQTYRESRDDILHYAPPESRHDAGHDAKAITLAADTTARPAARDSLKR